MEFEMDCPSLVRLLPAPFPHDSLLKTIWKVFREKKIFCFPGGMLLSCWRKVKPNYPHPDTPPTEEYMNSFSNGTYDEVHSKSPSGKLEIRLKKALGQREDLSQKDEG